MCAWFNLMLFLNSPQKKYAILFVCTIGPTCVGSYNMQCCVSILCNVHTLAKSLLIGGLSALKSPLGIRLVKSNLKLIPELLYPILHFSKILGDHTLTSIWEVLLLLEWFSKCVPILAAARGIIYGTHLLRLQPGPCKGASLGVNITHLFYWLCHVAFRIMHTPAIFNWCWYFLSLDCSFRITTFDTTAYQSSRELEKL